MADKTTLKIVDLGLAASVLSIAENKNTLLARLPT